MLEVQAYFRKTQPIIVTMGQDVTFDGFYAIFFAV